MDGAPPPDLAALLSAGATDRAALAARRDALLRMLQATEHALQQADAPAAADPAAAASPSPSPADGVAATPAAAAASAAAAAATPASVRGPLPAAAAAASPACSAPSPAWWAAADSVAPRADDDGRDGVAPTPGSQPGAVPESPGASDGGDDDRVGGTAGAAGPSAPPAHALTGTDIRLPRPVAALALSPSAAHAALVVAAPGGGTHVAVEAWRLPPAATGDPPPARVAAWPARTVPGAPPPAVVVVEDARGVPTILVGGGVTVVAGGGGSSPPCPTALTPGAPPLRLPTPFATTCVAVDADGDTVFAGGPAGGSVAALEAPPGRGPRAAAATPHALPSGGDALADVASLTCVGSAHDGMLAAASRAGGVAVWCLATRRVLASVPPAPPWPAIRRVAWLGRDTDGTVLALTVCQDAGRREGAGLLPRRAALVRVGGGAPPSWAPLAPALAADALAAVGSVHDAGGGGTRQSLLLAARGGGVLTVWRGRDGRVIARAALGGPDDGGVAVAVRGGGVRVACPSGKGVAVVDVSY